MISEQKAVGAFGKGTTRSDELNEELGLNVYDFGARNYDPALGRWMNIDPLAESFFSDIPYNYTLNNPISNIDPDGRFTFSLSGQAAQDFARNLQRELDQEENKKMMYGDEEHNPPPGGKVTNFFKGFGNGFKSGWNDTKKFVKSLRTEDGWLDMIRSSEVMFSPSINSNGDSYVKNERQQIYSSASNTLNNLDQLSSYDWGYSFGYASEKLAEAFVTRRFSSPTTADGFLFGGVTLKTPFNIPVQRFGNLNAGRPDFWGLQIGTGRFTNRTFDAILPIWNPLTKYNTGIIPKGTTVKFGIIGPQGFRYPGGSLQFILPSENVINKSTTIIP